MKVTEEREREKCRRVKREDTLFTFFMMHASAAEQRGSGVTQGQGS